MDKISKCPGCGNTEPALGFSTTHKKVHVHCIDCFMSGPACSTVDTAVTAWNFICAALETAKNKTAPQENSNQYVIEIAGITFNMLVTNATWSQPKEKAVTTVLLREYNKAVKTFTGLAICHPNDKSDYQTGVKVAFLRAAVTALTRLDNYERRILPDVTKKPEYQPWKQDHLKEKEAGKLAYAAYAEWQKSKPVLNWEKFSNK